MLPLVLLCLDLSLAFFLHLCSFLFVVVTSFLFFSFLNIPPSTEDCGYFWERGAACGPGCWVEYDTTLLDVSQMYKEVPTKGIFQILSQS